MHDDSHDERDPLRAAFDDHVHPPRDIVPHVAHRIADLQRLTGGAAQVRITHYDLTADGVTEHTEWATVTRPITPEGEKTL